METLANIPYCGAPPAPGDVAWNLDPVLIAVIAGLAFFHWRRLAPPAGRQRMLAMAGYAVALLAFISPLCNLSVALFSARVAQHAALILIAAPLLAAGMPARRPRPTRANAGACVAAVAAFAGLLWVWHMPGPYDATLASDVVYWAMHLSLFGSAILLWRVLLAGGLSSGVSIVAGIIAGFQMSLLGALLAFAPDALFSVHMTTTAPWGLTPLEDQQIGGLVMWVPAGLLLTGYAVGGLAAHLRRLERQAPA